MDPELLTADASLRVSIDHLLEGVQIIASDWRYRYLNQTAVRHAHRPVEELLGRTITECYPGIESTPMYAAIERVMHTRRAERMLNEFVYADGTRRWFDLAIDAVPDGVCVLSLDVTERREVEQQLQQAQKMETIGQLAGGIAHDFNNILTAILGYSELIAGQIGPDKPIGRDLQEIVTAAHRAAALTRQLLAFSRKQLVAPVPLSLNTVVHDIEPMLRRLITENVTIVTSLDPETPSVLADATLLEQVITNFVVNARDAIVDRGTVTITTRPAVLDAHYAATHVDVVAGDYAMLSVSDTGVGMTPAIQARIFEPFFTTKERGRGTGMGLAAVHGIVKQLGGSTWVYSEPGQGSVFKVYLPKTDRRPPTARTARQMPTAVGHETVLLVEDEAAVRSFVLNVLARHGYVVQEAASAEAALANSRQDRGIHLLLTDVMLPGVDGGQLALQLSQRWPDVRVLFMSGYADLAARALPHGSALLEKPFTAQALLECVRSVLDTPSRTGEPA